MKRRTLLASIGGGTISLAGCTTGTDTVGPTDDNDQSDRPEDCPISQGLGVEWPEAPDAATVEAFVEEYEHVYFRDVIVEYEPESRLDCYELSGSVTGRPKEVGTGGSRRTPAAAASTG